MFFKLNSQEKYEFNMSILCDAISIPIFIFFIKSPLWKFQYGILLGDRKGHVGITRFLQSLIMLLFHFFFFSWKCCKHQLLLIVSERAVHQHIGWGILPRLYGKHCSKKNYDVKNRYWPFFSNVDWPKSKTHPSMPTMGTLSVLLHSANETLDLKCKNRHS